MEDNYKIKKIVFLDTISHAKEYFHNNKKEGERKKDCLFIAINPAVYSFLFKRNLLVHNTLPYFKNHSHEQALEKSKILVDYLREKAVFSDTALRVNLAYRDSFIFFIRSAIHYCLYNIEVISNVVESYQTKVLFAPLFGRSCVLSPYIESEEKYFGQIVMRIAQNNSLDFKNSSIRKIINIFQMKNFFSIILKFPLRYIKFKIWENIILFSKLFDKRKVILFTTKEFQMDKLAKRFKEECAGTRFAFLQGPVISTFKLPDFIIKIFLSKYSKDFFAKTLFLKNIKKLIEEKADFFSYRNIPFGDILSKKLKDDIADYILGIFLWSINLDRFLNKLKPSLVLSNGNRADDIFLCELCRNKNIPTIFISHGSHTRPKNKYEIIEWSEHGRLLLSAPFPFLALQTPLSEGYLEVLPSVSKIIRTGPLIWGQPISLEKSKLLFTKIFNKKFDFQKTKVILYASTPKHRIRFYTYETNDEYVQALSDLANAVKNIPNTVLIVRFRQLCDDLKIEDLNTFMPFSEKIILSLKESFLDLLGMANLLVSFSSTTIEEALQNKIPVLLYGGRGRYQHIPAHEIKLGDYLPRKAVYHVKEAQDLEYAISNILNLNLDRNRDKNLFDRYIYSKKDRESIFDFINTYEKRLPNLNLDKR